MAFIYKILERKLQLYIKKTSLIGRIFAQRPHYIFDYGELRALRAVIKREIGANRRLLRNIKVHAEASRNHLEPVVIKMDEVTRELVHVLRQELKVLREMGLSSLALHEVGVLVFRKPRATFFDSQFAAFQQLYRREQELDAKLFAIASREKRDISSTKIKVYRGLARDIISKSKSLANSVGNNALVRKNAEDILALFRKLQNTELYVYMHGDISFIRNQLRGIMRDPSRSKVKTFLAAVYLFTPGSFDATVYILLLKNLTKVTVRKIRPGRFAVKRRAS